MNQKHLSDLDMLLYLAFAVQRCKEKKDFRKVVLKLAKRASPVQRKAILGNILPDERRSYKQAKENLWYHVENYLSIVVPAQEISAQGGVGMVIYKDEIFPIHVFCEEKEDRFWAIQNEHIMQLTALDGAMSKLGIRRMEARVLFFLNKGFSGITETIEVDRDGVTPDSRRIGDTNFFF